MFCGEIFQRFAGTCYRCEVRVLPPFELCVKPLRGQFSSVQIFADRSEPFVLVTERKGVVHQRAKVSLKNGCGYSCHGER